MNFTESLKNEEGTVQFIGHLEPDVKIPCIVAEQDSGPIVKALVNDSAGKNVIGYRAWLTMPEVAATFTKATGLKAESVTLAKGEFPLPLPDDLRLEIEDNFAYFNEFGYEARDDPTIIHPRDVSGSKLTMHRLCANTCTQLKSPPVLDTVENYWKQQDWSKLLGA